METADLIINKKRYEEMFLLYEKFWDVRFSVEALDLGNNETEDLELQKSLNYIEKFVYRFFVESVEKFNYKRGKE